MKKRQFLALFVALALLVSIFAGCGGDDTSSASGGGSSTTASESEAGETSEAGEESTASGAEEGAEGNVNLEGYPIVNEPITVSMMGQKAGIHGEWDQMEFFDIMEDMTNIGFTFDTPATEVLEEKKNLALNSGNYAEVLMGINLTRDQQVKYGTQGILLPLDEYIDKYCPNIVAMFEENPGVRASMTATDGHIYALGQLAVTPLMSTAMWVNIDWLDALGVDPEDLPTTVDGVTELFRRFRDEDPNGNGEQDEIPFSVLDDANKGDSVYNNMMPYFGVMSPEFWADDEGVVHYGMTDPNARDAFEWFNLLWEENLMDHDAYTQSSADALAKGTEGRNGAGFHALPRFVFGNMELEKEATYPVMPALSSDVNPEQTCAKGTGITQGVFALTDKCSEETAIAMMRWVDYLYSEEGSWLIHYGPEGHIWEVSPNDPELHVYIQPTDGRNVEEVRGGEITPDCGVACPKWVRYTTEGAWDDVQQQARIAWSEKNLNPYAKTVMPDLFLTEEEQSVVDTYLTDCKMYRQENGAKFVTGEKSFDEWDSFVADLKAMGVDEMLAAYQSAYDRWAEANGGTSAE